MSIPANMVFPIFGSDLKILVVVAGGNGEKNKIQSYVNL
jgi:hypothetical protein